MFSDGSPHSKSARKQEPIIVQEPPTIIDSYSLDEPKEEERYVRETLESQESQSQGLFDEDEVSELLNYELLEGAIPGLPPAPPAPAQAPTQAPAPAPAQAPAQARQLIPLLKRKYKFSYNGFLYPEIEEFNKELSELLDTYETSKKKIYEFYLTYANSKREAFRIAQDVLKSLTLKITTYLEDEAVTAAATLTIVNWLSSNKEYSNVRLKQEDYDNLKTGLITILKKTIQRQIDKIKSQQYSKTPYSGPSQDSSQDSSQDYVLPDAPPLAPQLPRAIPIHVKNGTTKYPVFDAFYSDLESNQDITDDVSIKAKIESFYLQYAKAEAPYIAKELVDESTNPSFLINEIRKRLNDWLRNNDTNTNETLKLNAKDRQALSYNIKLIFNDAVEAAKKLKMDSQVTSPGGPSSGAPSKGGPSSGGPSSGGPSSGTPSSSGSSKGSSTQYRYSITSDHKLVYLVFKLLGLTPSDSDFFTAMSYNMSYLSDLGPKIPKGSEALFLSTIIGDNRRIYWQNAALLVQCFINHKNPDIMFFQEMNDREAINNANPDPYYVTLNSGIFVGGYQALLELLSGSTPATPAYTETKVNNQPSGSYYKHGSFKIGDVPYYYLAYSVAKGNPVIYPTVLTIWKTRRLGEFSNFYGNDFGEHTNYTFSTTDYGYVPFLHHGRNFSCVRTKYGANLVNIHGPNAPSIADPKLKEAIQTYLQQSYTTFREPWYPNATVIGGDTNDASNKVTSIPFNSEVYSHQVAPKSCCFENPQNFLANYPYYGDKIYVANPFNPILLYEEYDCPLGIFSGGEKNKYYRSLKKKKKARKASKARKAKQSTKSTKARKAKQSRYNKKKTVKKPRFRPHKNIRSTRKR